MKARMSVHSRILATFFLCFQLMDISFAHDFYPFGQETNDTAMDKNDDGSTPDIPISTKFPFFNAQQTSLIVNTNGAISFLQPVSTYTPSPFPLDGDRRLLTPYWSDVDTNNGGTVWYRETTSKSIRDRATAEIRKYFPDFFRFSATWIFIATWDKVAFYGCSETGCKKRNTFQAILVTNGQHSFAIFNYGNITWTTGRASNGSADTGLGGTPAQVGFNAGDGKVFRIVNSSRTSDIIHINKKTNVNEPGKFIFRIDSSKIRSGGCNTNGSLTITPKSGHMLGGQYIVVSGPCLEDSTDINITYSNIKESFPCQRKSNYSVICITPMFSTTGIVDVDVTVISQGKEKHFKGHFKILNPSDCKINLFRHDRLEWPSGHHKISWTKEASEIKEHRHVDIHAFIVKEEGGMFRWKKKVIKKGVKRLIGHYYIDLDPDWSGSVVALRLTSRIKTPKAMPDRGIWSDIFPIVNEQRQAMRQCENWIKMQKDTPWTPSEVEPCPCTLQQAMLDIARYQPDPDCNMFTKRQQRDKPTCLYRRNAIHCIRLAKPRQDGSDSVCCYDQNNNLMDARSKEGGTIQRYHFEGGDGNVPYVSNFYHDVVPYLQCCRYSQRIENCAVNPSLCKDFLLQRNQLSCTNYAPPRPARTSGDPHITTIDGFGYTFNGVGEFHYLLTVDRKFISQIRFEQFQIDGTMVDASVATAFAARTANITVEARLNSIRTLDIILNGKQLEMDETSFSRYDGLSIIDVTSTKDGNTQRKEYFLIFPSVGISFKLYGSKSFINIIPLISNNDLKGKMRGLLGNYDDDKSNDLITSNNTTLSSNSSSQKIYTDFGMTWAIKRSESIFSYEEGKKFDYYHRPGFTPVFVPQLQIPDTVKRTCKDDKECIFDYQVTGSVEIAAITKEVGDVFRVQESAAQLVSTCKDLPSSSHDSNGKWVATNGTMNGSIASFECIEGFFMDSTNQEPVMCKNGSWQTAFKNLRCQLNETYVKEIIRRKRNIISNVTETSNTTETPQPSTNKSIRQKSHSTSKAATDITLKQSLEKTLLYSILSLLLMGTIRHYLSFM